MLVEPQGALNIGSVARAMMNFGFSDLRLVNPQTDHLSDEARRMAVKATSLLEGAQIHPDLPSALADCHLAMGTTRRFGKYREDFLHPDQAAQEILALPPAQRTALVFGREDKGLHTAELDLCQRLITIPTGDLLPSMNLAQAVSLCLYEAAKAAGAAAGKGSRAAAAGARRGPRGDVPAHAADAARLSVFSIRRTPTISCAPFAAFSAARGCTSGRSASCTASGAASTGSKGKRKTGCQLSALSSQLKNHNPNLKVKAC